MVLGEKTQFLAYDIFILQFARSNLVVQGKSNSLWEDRDSLS
jgi:hypothetical protein